MDATECRLRLVACIALAVLGCNHANASRAPAGAEVPPAPIAAESPSPPSSKLPVHLSDLHLSDPSTLPPPLALDVQLAFIPEPALQMTLTNRTDRPISVPSGLLPWREGGSMSIQAATCESPHGTRLDRLYRFDDPPYEPVWMAPGQSLKETYRLDWLFPDLMETLGQTDVEVLWKYQLAPQGFSPVKLKGCVVVPKTGTQLTAQTRECGRSGWSL